MHNQAHPLQGHIVAIGVYTGDVEHFPVFFRGKVIDWYDRETARKLERVHSLNTQLEHGWFFRQRREGLPVDDDIVIVDINGIRYIVHQKEIELGRSASEEPADHRDQRDQGVEGSPAETQAPAPEVV